MYREVGAFWEVLAQKTIGARVGAALAGVGAGRQDAQRPGGIGQPAGHRPPRRRHHGP